MAVVLGGLALVCAAVAMSFWGSGIEVNAVLFGSLLLVGAVLLTRAATRFEVPGEEPVVVEEIGEPPQGEWSSEPE